MKKVFVPFAIACLSAMTLVSCKKDVKEADVSTEALNQIKSLGFSTDGVQKTASGYLVEGDINLSESDLKSRPTSPNMIIANEEQYHTFNMVNTTNHANINIALTSGTAVDAAFSAALDEAVNRYNAENLAIHFTRVATTQSPDITIVAFYEVSNTLGSSGFPNAAGDPYNQVKMNTYWYNASTGASNVNYIATIMAHEVGHCVGFRHTDYMNRAYSCGGRKSNEGQANTGVGAVYIPGTPTGGDPNSWMLACVGDQVNRPFNSNDKIALGYVY